MLQASLACGLWLPMSMPAARAWQDVAAAHAIIVLWLQLLAVTSKAIYRDQPHSASQGRWPSSHSLLSAGPEGWAPPRPHSVPAAT